MRKLILRCGLAPGDIVMLTAAVRDLHHRYPSQFLTDVRTACPEIWENNPYITPIGDDEIGAEYIDCSYTLIDAANYAPYHCLHGFIEFFNEKFGLSIRPTVFRGDIHLSELEKAWYSQVREVTRRDIPFWIVAAGGKHDITIKWWETERYQGVVNRLAGKVQFVQVGGLGHHHPRLDGVIDLRGQTNLRELIRLVHHADGVLCSTTALMHLAAAVEPKGGWGKHRACVVIAGGREPAHWEQYPGHQYLQTIGMLPCCATGGCWKDRTFALRDGNHRDRPQNLCSNVVGLLPKCLDMITADDVVSRIEAYFTGGGLQSLSRAEQRAARRGIAMAAKNSYDDQILTMSEAGWACDRALSRLQDDGATGEGRGIVVCGGGVRYFTCAWVAIKMLRRWGCALPIEVWHLGRAEMTEAMKRLLEPLGVQTIDAYNVRRSYPVRDLKGWELKVYAIIHSRFREALLLDADNVPVANPEFLFDCDEFKTTGALFWPDFKRTSENSDLPIWRSCGLRRPSEQEFETGQILVDKSRCWKALQLCLWFNENSDFYYQHIYGDKETFHLAFRKARKAYHLIRHPVVPLERTMCQHDPRGERLFQHRNFAKWDLVTNRRIEGFWFESECLGYLAELKEQWDGSASSCRSPAASVRRIRGEARLTAIIASADGAEAARTRQSLIKTDWDGAPIVSSIAGEEASLYGFLEKALDLSSEYLLLLQGDLIFNRHLRHNLAAWRPIRTREAAVAGVFNPRILEAACDFANNVRIARIPKHLGDEAVLFSAAAAKVALEVLKRRRASVPFNAGKLAAKLGRPLVLHAPSLAQRAPTCSDPALPWAFDFEPEWRG